MSFMELSVVTLWRYLSLSPELMAEAPAALTVRSGEF